MNHKIGMEYVDKMEEAKEILVWKDETGKNALLELFLW